MPETVAARLAQLEALFGVELAERVQTLSRLLAELEGGDNPNAARSIARTLHSLKAAARAVGASEVEAGAAAAEAIAVGPLDIASLRRAIDELPRSREPRGETNARSETPKAHERPSVDRTDRGSVRVGIGKLDTLLTESGELSVTHVRINQRLSELRELQRELERWQREWTRSRPARARLRRGAHRTAREVENVLRAAEHADRQTQAIVQRTREIVADLAQNTAQLATVATAISEEVMAIRLLPAGTIFVPLERMVRDLARQIGKEARLELAGTETELDRRILDELRDPLMHMVRNSLDHGLESPADRLRTGKPAEGTLRLSASQRGDRVHIVMEDDGRGLDLDAIRETAVRRNLVTAERADALDAAALTDYIFHPGFSTRAAVSELSGRGVGMDVVRDHVGRLGGSIGVRSTRGTGTTFTISVPLTLATTRVLLVQDGGHTYAVPSSSIERTGRIRARDLQRLEGRLALQIDGRPVPVVELSSVLQRPSGATVASDEWRPFFVLAQGERAVALLTDRLIDETELVVKALGAPLKRVRHVSGAAVLGSGAVVVILNGVDVFKSALGDVEHATHFALPKLEGSTADEAQPKQRVLVVDDSVMTRTLERTILESAGYSVVVASDGMHALELLNEAAVDAIVSDVEMPRMNGLELTATLRQDERWRHLPIVLVTSLDSPEHVERGASAGADAYIVKGRFDQNDLLQTIGRLL